MSSVVIIILCFSFFFFLSKQKGNKLISYLYFIYTTSFISSLILFYVFNQKCDKDFSVIAMFYLMIILLLWFYPFGKINNNIISNVWYDKNKFKNLSWISILILCPATFFFAMYFYILFSEANIAVVRLSGENISLLPNTVYNTFISVFSGLYIIPLILFFVSVRDKCSKLLSILLLIASFSFPLLTLCFAGRDGIVYWLMNFLILYFIFKNALSRVIIKRIKGVLSIFFALIVGVLLFISINRFGGNLDKNLFISMLDYFGQQIGNFSDAFFIDMDYSLSLFDGFKKLLGIESSFDKASKLSAQNAYSEYNVFGTFAKTLIWGYGKFGSILISILFMVLVTKIRKVFIKNNNLLYFIIIYIIYQIPMNGVFYYRQGVGSMDVIYISIIIVLLLMLKYKFTYNMRK